MSDEAFARRFYSDRAELVAARRAAPLAARRVHRRGAVHAALRAVLPAGAAARGRRAGRAPDGALPPRGEVRLRGAAAARAPEPRARPPGPARGAHDRERRARGAARSRLLGRDVRPPDEARERDLEAADDQVPLLDDHPRRGGRAHGQPVRAPPGAGLLVPDRPRPRQGRAAHLPRLAHPRRHPLRDEARARLPRAGGLRPVRPPRPRRRGSSARSRARRRSSSTRTRPGGSSARSASGHVEDDVFRTDYADLEQLATWILKQDGRARPLAPPELVDEIDALARGRRRAPTRGSRPGSPRPPIPARRSRRSSGPRARSRRSASPCSRRCSPTCSPAAAKGPAPSSPPTS